MVFLPMDVWASVVTGSISTLASLTIIYMIVSDRRVKLQSPNNRILLCMSIIDVTFSIAYALNTLPRMTAATCTIQGFFLLFGGTAVPCYNASLCWWFLKSITQNMHPKEFRQMIEPYCHALSLLIPLILSTVYTSLDIFEPTTGTVCWIPDDIPHYLVFNLMGAVIPCICFSVIIFSLLKIYSFFSEKERAIRRTGTSTSNMQWRLYKKSSLLKAKRKAAKQGFLFSCSFFITWIFTGINLLFLSPFLPGERPPLALPQAIFMPLQGFWNFIVYIRPTLERIQEEYPDLSFVNALRKIIFQPSQVRTRSGRRGRSLSRLSPTTSLPMVSPSALLTSRLAQGNDVDDLQDAIKEKEKEDDDGVLEFDVEEFVCNNDDALEFQDVISSLTM